MSQGAEPGRRGDVPAGQWEDHPARAVAELVRGLWKEGGKGLKKGDIILSGAITPSTPVQVGDALRADFGGMGYVEIQIKE